MRILHLNSEKTWRGGEQQMAYLAAELYQNGINSSLAFPPQNSRLIQVSEENNFESVYIPFGGLQLLASFKLFLWLRKNKIDLIHTHTAKAHTVAVWANFLGAKTSIVVSKRTDFKVKTPYKFHYKYVKAILCVSKMIEKITKDGLHPKKKGLVQTVHSGVDINRFNSNNQITLKDKYQIPKNKILIGNCSAIAPHKDYETFIDTAQILNEQYPEKFHFIIIGDGPDKKKIESYCENKLLKEKFTFTGFLLDLELHLKSLDFFLMSSEEEGLGTSLLDAMICEIPIVSTNAGGIPEIVIHEQTGLLAGVKDSKALADNILRLVNDNELKEKLVVNAKQQVIKDYSKEHTCEKTIAVYREIISKQ
jgi:glycosyltransferase involved in cell wall biosynthesis